MSSTNDVLEKLLRAPAERVTSSAAPTSRPSTYRPVFTPRITARLYNITEDEDILYGATEHGDSEDKQTNAITTHDDSIETPAPEFVREVSDISTIGASRRNICISS